MNVLIIPSWYPEEPQDLNGSFFREQAIALRKTGQNVYVLNGTFTSYKNAFDAKCRSIIMQEDSGIIIYRKLIPSLGFSRSVPLCITLFRRRIRQLLNTFQNEHPDVKIDVIHAHSCFPAGKVACEIGMELGIPVVITEHRSTYIHETLPIDHQKLLQECVNKCSSFLCVSKGLKRNIQKFIGGNTFKLDVLPNMYSSIFEPTSTTRKVEKEFRFISVGGLIPLKRHVQLVRCFGKAFTNDEPVILNIIGEGREREAIEAEIAANNLGKKVHLLGKKTREEVASELKISDVFVLTSSYETFGVVYIEAMACGLPVIGTRNGGANDLILPENGIIIDVDQDNQLIAALHTMYENAKDYDRRKIAMHARCNYSEESVTGKLISIYRNCINR